MRRSNAFQDGCFEGWGFVELLPFEHAQGLANDIAFIGVTSGMDETIHKLIQCRRQGDSYGIILSHSQILSRLGLRGKV